MTAIRLFLERMGNTKILCILFGFFAGTVLGSIASHLQLGDAANWWGWADSILQNLGAEMCGAIVTFLLIGVLAERRQTKEQLIRAMRSNVRDVAVPAVEELRAHGWLTDGSLKGACLGNANLEEAVLVGANLEGADLVDTTLDSQTTLPDGTRYNPDQGLEQLDRFTDPNHPNFGGRMTQDRQPTARQTPNPNPICAALPTRTAPIVPSLLA